MRGWTTALALTAVAVMGACSDDDSRAACQGDECVYVPMCTGCQCEDTPCGEQQICEEATGQCLTRECVTDEDCAEGRRCTDGFCVVIDRDGDGILDDEDNCPDTPTTDQTDDDADGVGNWCDSDIDGDDVDNLDDNCVYAFNPAQFDNDGDGLGDACANTVTIVATFVSDELVPGDSDQASLAVADQIDAGGMIPRATFAPVSAVPYELELKYVEPGEWIVIYCYNRSGSRDCRGPGDRQGAYDNAMPVTLVEGETIAITIDLDP